MKIKFTILFLALLRPLSYAQTYDTIYFDAEGLVSDRIESSYFRIVNIEEDHYRVKDYYFSGQLEMEAVFCTMNPFIKELAFSFFSFSPNIKQGLYRRWYENGQLKFECHYIDNKAEGTARQWDQSGQQRFQYTFKNGQADGPEQEWYSNGNYYSTGTFKNDFLHGKWTFYNKNGEIVSQREYEEGYSLDAQKVSYQYLSYLPSSYEIDPSKSWPLIICLHGVGGRGDNLDLIRKEFQTIIVANTDTFIVIAPQCPAFIHWTTDNWFDNLMIDIESKFRIDKNRIYLTGASMGGQGTWDIAVRYPEVFAAIAPLCSNVSSKYTMDNIEKLENLPVWTFYGLKDWALNIQKTEQLIAKLKIVNSNVSYTRYPDLGHDIWHKTYSDPAFYTWLLSNRKSD